jgi:hypothetical protein
MPVADYSAQYGPLAFGMASFLILLGAVWVVLIRPANEQRTLDREERGRDLDKISAIAVAQTTLGEALRATANANAKATEDLKTIAKVHEAGMAQMERMTTRLDKIAEHEHDHTGGRP